MTIQLHPCGDIAAHDIICAGAEGHLRVWIGGQKLLPAGNEIESHRATIGIILAL